MLQLVGEYIQEQVVGWLTRINLLVFKVPALRRPHEKHKRRAGFEDLLIQGPEGSEGGWENVNPFVFCTGIVYGDGEEALEAIFKDAWLGPTLSEGSLAMVAPDGRVPMVHRADVIQGVVATLGESPPGEPYMFAVDAATNRFTEVVSAISSGVSGSFSGGIGGQPQATTEPSAEEAAAEEETEPVEGEDQAEVEVAVTKDKPEEVNLAELECKAKWEAQLKEAVDEGYLEGSIAIDLVLDSGPFMDFIGEDVEDEPPKWRSREGIVKNVAMVGAEYLEKRGLGAMRAMIATADLSMASKAPQALGDRISKRYKVPHLTFEYVIEQVSNSTGAHYSEDIHRQMDACFAAEGNNAEPMPEEEAAAEEKAEEAAAEEEAPEDAAPQQRPDTPASGWTPKSAVFIPSRELYMDPRASKLRNNPELMELMYRQVLGTQICRNLGFVLNASALNVAQLDRIFRDLPVEVQAATDENEEPAEDAPAPESTSAPDGRIEGKHLPEFCIVIEGNMATKQDGVADAVQYVLDTSIAKKRNQNVIRLAEKDLLDPITERQIQEAVIQEVGRPRHFGFDGDQSESLSRLDPKTVAETAGDVEDKGDKVADRKNKQKELNDRKRIADKAEVLSSAVDSELQERAATIDMPARAYALEYAMPALHRAMCMAGRIRPEDPIDFVANFMMHYKELKDTLPEPGKLKLPEVGKRGGGKGIGG